MRNCGISRLQQAPHGTGNPGTNAELFANLPLPAPNLPQSFTCTAVLTTPRPKDTGILGRFRTIVFRILDSAKTLELVA
jgi:hypothetical protein